MRARAFQVDAFTDRLFAGNPAAVVLLDDWPRDDLLQDVAAENNLSETAFLVRQVDAYELRWFTPTDEVDLCGHATLAAGFVVLGFLEGGRRDVAFHTRSGRLGVRREGRRYAMDFPALRSEPVPEERERTSVLDALGAERGEVLAAKDYLVVLGSEDDVRSLRPDFDALRRLDRRGVVATAAADPGDDGDDLPAPDFVSRFFAPRVGVPEDPVTGSAHCALAPYWSERLGRRRLVGRQVSRRGGTVHCEDRGERVTLAGDAVLFLDGTVRIPTG
ncbi:MAG: PhzF family phenazine biosynthesis protein [Gemmatimonadota bacterium]